MRETPAAYRARTGADYRPAGAALADDAACPTLFRYPGAGALHQALSTRLTRLGPEGSDTLWLCADATLEVPGGAAHFGALAVLEPLALGASPTDVPGVYRARNADVPEAGVVWIPPRLLAAPTFLDDVATAGALAQAWPEERALALQALSSYLEELDALSRAGATLPGRWSELDDERRRQVLTAHGIVQR